jgi:hypothetical protein
VQLVVTHPSGCRAERKYIYQLLLEKYLGCTVEYKISNVEAEAVVISCNDRALRVDDSFFGLAEKHWLQAESMPSSPGVLCDLPQDLRDKLQDTQVPVLYGNVSNKNKFFNKDCSAEGKPETISLALDIFGSAFFMLSRYEEIVNKNRDPHSRFSAKDSIAFKEGFLMRPIVNEYIEILSHYLQWLLPDFSRQKPSFETQLSCDVDVPYSQSRKGPYYFMRQLASDVFTWKSPARIFNSIKLYAEFRNKDYSKDPFDTFDAIMDECEKRDMVCTFNFICDRPAGPVDGIYSLDEEYIQGLLKKVHDRGHQVGLHVSYGAFRDQQQMQSEFDALKQFCNKLGIRQEFWSNRQHYLRWHTPDTARQLESIGITTDTTLGYADHVGFRAGICHSFNLYDLKERRELSVVETPLIVMEASMLSKAYMNLDHSDALEIVTDLKCKCQRFGGKFTMLWHNHMLAIPENKKLFLQSLG